MLKHYNKIDKLFFITGFLLETCITIYVKSSIIAYIQAMLSICNAVATANGKVSSHVFGLFESVLYIYLSYQNNYYSEIIVNSLIFIPLSIYGLISWKNNTQDDNSTIIINRLSKKELVLAIGSQVLMFYPYYCFLKYFNSSLLFFSSLSMCLNILGTYFNARRSKYSFYAYILNCIVKITLWIAPIINGDFTSAPVLISSIMYLIFDFYAVKKWNKMQNNL